MVLPPYPYRSLPVGMASVLMSLAAGDIPPARPESAAFAPASPPFRRQGAQARHTSRSSRQSGPAVRKEPKSQGGSIAGDRGSGRPPSCANHLPAPDPGKATSTTEASRLCPDAALLWVHCCADRGGPSSSAIIPQKLIVLVLIYPEIYPSPGRWPQTRPGSPPVSPLEPPVRRFEPK